MYQLPAGHDLTWDLERLTADRESAPQLPIPLQPISQQLGVAAIAERVTMPAVEATNHDLLRPAIEGDNELLEKAIAVRQAIDTDLKKQAAAIRLTRPSGMEVTDYKLDWALEDAQRGDWSRLERCGLRVDSGWFRDVVRSMLRGQPVEVEIAHTQRPHVARDAAHGYSLNYDQQFSGQQIGLGFGAMLRRVGGFDYTRPVVLVDDLTFSDHWFAVNALHRQQAVRRTYDTLLQADVVSQDSRPGEDFVIVPDSRSMGRTGELIERLRDAEGGLVVPQKDGQLRLRPSERVYRIASQQHAGVTPELFRDGVLLQQADGTPTSVAVQAASYLDPINASFTHLRLRDTQLIDLLKAPRLPPTDHQELSVLLQSLDIIYPDRDHYIDYDHRLISPAHAVYALTRLLRNEVAVIARTTHELDDVRNAMKPKTYFEHNYRPEGGVWSEDVQGARVIGNELPLHYRPGEVTSAAVIGYGPFTYSALAIAPFMQEDAVIDISDLLAGNIAFAEEWFNGTADDNHNSAYRQFGDLFRQSGKTGRFYEHCEDQLRAHGRLRVAAQEELEPDSVQLLIESFVSCSRLIAKRGFYDAIRHKARLLTWTPHSMMVSLHMVGSGGWNNSGDDEGIKIPAAPLSIQDIESGYHSSGLRIVKCVPLHADAGFRKDYKGMVAVFAKPDTVERPWSLAA